MKNMKKENPFLSNEDKRKILKYKPKKTLNPFKAMRLFFAKKLKAKVEKKVLIHQTNNRLQELIDEYRLIMKKESTLPSTRRREIIDQVEKFIESGHISIN
jgi:hypothetical protein